MNKMTAVKLDTVPSGTLLLNGSKWQDVKYISNNYFIKILTFSDGSTRVKAVRLFYSRTGKKIGELTSGYSAKSATELLKQYPWLQ